MVRGAFGALALVMALVVTLVARDGRASVSVAVTWDGLLRESSAAGILTPVESRSAWEDGRIYTYTRLSVDRSVAGALSAGSSVWVRTMGGVVGKIGQIVEGEAVFTPGHASLLFLHPGPIGAFEVTARGQGQFPVVTDDAKTPARVVRSNAMGAIVPRSPSPQAVRLAVEVVHGRVVDEVASAVAADWSRTHTSSEHQ
jgi:hypothetical protein